MVNKVSTRRRHLAAARGSLIAGAALLAAAACGPAAEDTAASSPPGAVSTSTTLSPSPTTTTSTPTTTTPAPPPSSATTAPPAPAVPAEVAANHFSPALFDARSAEITNPWIPLRPGSQWTFVGSANNGEGGRFDRRVVFAVTDLTKVIAGVKTRVIFERDFDDDSLVEIELAFFAQDRGGNVWHLGQHPEEYDNGAFVANPTWLAGLKGARAGVLMRSNPRLGQSAFSEGYAPPPINWVDWGKIFKMGERVCVKSGCHPNTLEIREYETGKPNAFQHKFYAKGLGFFKVGWSGSAEDEQETLELRQFSRLNAAQAADIRARALALEASAYKKSKDVYARSARAQ